VLNSLLDFSDGRRRTAWIYAVYRLNRKYPVARVGKPAAIPAAVVAKTGHVGSPATPTLM
jgi:hypothetical protein